MVKLGTYITISSEAKANYVLYLLNCNNRVLFFKLGILCEAHLKLDLLGVVAVFEVGFYELQGDNFKIQY